MRPASARTPWLRHVVGGVRPTQLMHTFGVGAIVDLPGISVMVMGLDEWDTSAAREVRDDRLLGNARRLVGPSLRRMLIPPSGDDGPADGEFTSGIGVSVFPRWLVCVACRHLGTADDTGVFRLVPNRWRPERTRFEHALCQHQQATGPAPDAIPARFLRACRRGHLDDFPWEQWPHRGRPMCGAPRLRLLHRGPSGEAADVFVRCITCDAQLSLADAFGENAPDVLGACTARRPHLRDHDDEECTEQPRAILLGASNSWFPMSLSALAIPLADALLVQLVDEEWGDLSRLEEERDIEAVRRLGRLRRLSEYPPSVIWQAMLDRRRRTETASATPLRPPEWRVLSAPDIAPRGTDFDIRRVAPPAGFEEFFEPTVAADRLREVRAFVGFTRIDSPADADQGADADSVQAIAPLRRGPTDWIPAVEVRGEGVLVRLREERVREWEQRPGVERHGRRMSLAHAAWCTQRGIDTRSRPFPGMRFVLVHSLSHALLRALALECGYALASLRERLYVAGPDGDDDPMCGVLIYTSAPDSEGTLGGVVSLAPADRLGSSVRVLLDAAAICSSDPLCAEHQPSRELPSLHGAACHACTFVPETSCERGNRYLDRAAVVDTLSTRGVAFFADVTVTH
jgi:hypothetical protein